MDFLVKVAETGVAFSYTNNPSNEKISYLQEKILSDTNIEIKDQVLITKEGYRLESSDTLASLESDNLLQMSIHSNGNHWKPNFDLYVFDQKKCSDTNLPNNQYAPCLFDRNENLENYQSKIIDHDYPTDFQSQPGVSEVLENITKTYPEILEVESKLFVHLTTIKKKFVEYKNRSKKLQRFRDEFQNQIQSFDVLLKHAFLLYKQCKSKKNDVLKHFGQVQDQNLDILKSFDEGLEIMKKIDLHEALQSKTQKTVMDVYFSEKEMYKWRNTCLKLENDTKSGIEESASSIETIRKKLADEKERCTETVTKYMHNINLEPITQEGETVLLALVLQVYRGKNFSVIDSNNLFQDYRALRETLEKFPDNDETQKLADSKWKNLYEKVWKEDIDLFNKNIEKIDKVLDHIYKMKMGFELPIIIAYNTIMRYAGELTMISNEKLKQLSDEVDKIESDFRYLLNPSLFPTAYWASLAEVSRRKEFALVFDYKYKDLKDIIDTEKEKRKNFLAQYGNILPSDFMPQLQNMPPVLRVDNLDIDSTLPNITNIPNIETEPSEDIRVLVSKSKRPYSKTRDLIAYE